MTGGGRRNGAVLGSWCRDRIETTQSVSGIYEQRSYEVGHSHLVMVWSYCGSGWGWDTQSYSVRQLLTCVVLGGLNGVLTRDEYIGNRLWLFPGQLCNLLLTYKLTVVLLVRVYYDHEEDVLWIGTRSICTVAHPPWQTGARQSEQMGIGIMLSVSSLSWLYVL